MTNKTGICDDILEPLKAMRDAFENAAEKRGYFDFSRTTINGYCDTALQDVWVITKQTFAALATVSSDAQPGFPERDASKPAEQQGLFRKFDVRRVDGSDRPGGKHYGCRYYVLDLDHDKHTPAAMRAYAAACKGTHPNLAADIESEFGASPAPDVRPSVPVTVTDETIARLWGAQSQYHGGEPCKVGHVEFARAILAQAAPAQPQEAGQARNWTEDEQHENGNYICHCVTCGHHFFGHKRRVTCKVCAKPAPAVPDRATMIERMKAAIEGECDGLAIDDNCAAAILDYVSAATPSAPAVSADASGQPCPVCKGEGAVATNELDVAPCITCQDVEGDADSASVSADARDGERYRAIKARHAYLIVMRLIGEDGYRYHLAPQQIDAWADKAVSEVSAYEAMSEEGRRASLQRDLDATQSKEGGAA